MNQNLYELLWQVETDSLSFFYREFKVFSSDIEAKQYGRRREVELNGGTSIQESAQDGYYFKYFSACRIEEIDGFIVKLAQ